MNKSRLTVYLKDGTASVFYGDYMLLGIAENDWIMFKVSNPGVRHAMRLNPLQIPRRMDPFIQGGDSLECFSTATPIAEQGKTMIATIPFQDILDISLDSKDIPVPPDSWTGWDR